MKIAIGIFLAVLLTACGGGDPDDTPDRDIGQPDCKANPELCK